MLTVLKDEEWKPLKIKGQKTGANRYAFSSLGRAASFQQDVLKDGKLLRGSVTAGYRTLNLHLNGGNNTFYFHREIARLFLPGKSRNQKFVIHLNHDRADNRLSNLAWANQKAVIDHQQNSPGKLAYKLIQRAPAKGSRLNTTQVKAIKKILLNPRRRITNVQLAEKYQVSVMTIYRIKSNENWKHVVI